MHLMIFDPHDRGHYLGYVRYLLRAVGSAARVTLVLRSGVDASVLFTGPDQPSADLRLEHDIRPDSYRIGSDLCEDFRQACDRYRPDHIWVPSGDLLAK